MDKSQALHAFWSSFGLPAYDDAVVLDRNAQMPYITYGVSLDSMENTLRLNASLWYRSTSWKEISEKAENIAQYISHMYPPSVRIDGGRMYITKGTPFAQRMSDEDPMIRRIVLAINVEFLTES